MALTAALRALTFWPKLVRPTAEVGQAKLRPQHSGSNSTELVTPCTSNLEVQRRAGQRPVRPTADLAGTECPVWTSPLSIRGLVHVT